MTGAGRVDLRDLEGDGKADTVVSTTARERMGLDPTASDVDLKRAEAAASAGASAGVAKK